MNHLDKMPCSCCSAVEIAVFRGQCNKERLKLLKDLTLTAYHQAIAFLQSPDTAACPYIGKLYAELSQRFGVFYIVFIKGIAAVYYQVALRQQPHQLGYNAIDRRPGRNHHPDYLRRRQGLNQLLKARNTSYAVALGLFNILRVMIKPGDLMTTFGEPSGHIHSHLS